MAQIAWRQQMELSYPPLDDEHKAFLKVVNAARLPIRMIFPDSMIFLKAVMNMRARIFRRKKTLWSEFLSPI